MNVLRVGAEDRGRAEECAQLMVSSEPWITLERSFESALRAVQDPGKELYAVLDGQRVAAFVLLDLRGVLAGYIQSICVRSDLRGRGIGTALIRWAEQRILEESPNVFICVSSFNDAARRLYERLGYTLVGSLTSFIVRSHDELLLRKATAPWSEFRSR